MKKLGTLALLGLLLTTLPTSGQETPKEKPLTKEEQAKLQEAIQLNGKVILLYRAGRHSEAIPLALQVLELRKAVQGEKHPDYARSLNDLARLYQAQGDYAKAEPIFRQALELLEAVPGEKHFLYAASLNNLAELYRTQGQYGKAEPLYRQAVELFKSRRGGKHPAYATSLNNLALLYQDQGDYAKAEPLYRQALELTKAIQGEKERDYANILNNLAVLYYLQGDYAKAEPLYRQALELRRAVLGEKHPHYASSLNNLAALYKAQGDYAKAEPLYRQALELFKAVLGEKHPEYATCLNNLALLYEAQDGFSKAEPLHCQALEIKKAVLGENHPAYALSLNNLAALYQAQGEYAKAEPLYRQALLAQAPAYRGPFTDLPPTAFRLSPETTRCLRNYSRLLRQRLGRSPSLAQLRACDHAYALTLAAQERLRQETLRHDDSNLQHGADDFAVVPGRLRVLRLLYAAEGKVETLHSAVTTAEQGRGRVFLDQLGRARAGVLPGLAPALRQREAGLLDRQRQLDLAYTREADRGLKADGDRLRQLFEERRQAEDDLQKLVAEMVQASPQYAALRYPKPCTIAEARACLASNEVALLFALGGDVSAVVLLEKAPTTGDKADGIAIHELPKAADINELVASLTDTEALQKPARLRSVGREAYQMLLAPLADRIKGKDLVIVPGESLCYLPFELLQENGKYLIENHKVRYAPSLTALHMIRLWEKSRTTRPDLPLFALGDPVYDKQDARLSGNTGAVVANLDTARDYQAREGRRDESFARLIHSGREVETLGRLLKTPAANIRTGVKALEADIKKASASGELARCRYIHFATHGILGSGDGKPPALVLSLVGNDDVRDEFGRNEGFLRLDEVTGLKLNADLVVLSACRSGQGQLRNGEGVSGLARAFLYAGSRGVVCSLWSVADAETADLMTDMYRRLQAGKPAADALREARLEMLRAGKPPIYWAPFILIGE